MKEKRKNYLTALILCFFIGHLGAHRFYLGKVKTGVLMAVTLGGFGLWTLFDFIVLLAEKRKSKKEKVLSFS